MNNCETRNVKTLTFRPIFFNYDSSFYKKNLVAKKLQIKKIK